MLTTSKFLDLPLWSPSGAPIRLDFLGHFASKTQFLIAFLKKYLFEKPLFSLFLWTPSRKTGVDHFPSIFRLFALPGLLGSPREPSWSPSKSFSGLLGLFSEDFGLSEAQIFKAHFATLQLAICHLPFAICHLPLAVCNLPFAICDLLPFAICPLSFAICHCPFNPATPEPRPGVMREAFK